ncbi:hypothetical protein ABPG74_006798 [Tetrahymena malaccensis]
MLRLLTIFGALILQSVLCEEIIKTESYRDQTLINFSLGFPPVSLKLQLQFGIISQYKFGDFIIDKSFTENDKDYANKLLSNGINNLYATKESSTALQGEPLQVKKILYSDEISGNYVNDILMYNGLQSKYQFACVTGGKFQSFYHNGVIYFDRLGQNIFDQMYQSQTIKTSDYILSGSLKSIQDYYSNSTQYQISINFDLDQNSEYYKYPSNPMISNSDIFEVMSYGIYLNDEDVTDKLKYKKVSFDQITIFDKIEQFIYFPTDFLKLYQMKYNQQGRFVYPNCGSCQCEQVANLPEITLITEEYKISIKPSSYLISIQDHCQLYIKESDRFQISSSQLFHTDTKIMYQKQSNSIKIINGQLISHFNLNYIIVIFSTFSGFIITSLLYIILKYQLNYKQYKLEEINQKKLINQNAKLNNLYYKYVQN